MSAGPPMPPLKLCACGLAKTPTVYWDDCWHYRCFPCLDRHRRARAEQEMLQALREANGVPTDT